MTIGKKEERYESTVPDTLDLAERAKLGLNHFTELIEEKLNYEMYYNVSFEFNTPAVTADLSSLIGCQSKALTAMVMLRVMSGSTQNLDRETKMVEMIASLLGDEGLYWVPKCPNKPWLGPEECRPFTHPAGNAMTMRAMMVLYQWTGESVWKKRIDRMVEGIDRLMVVHKDDYAYFPVRGWIEAEYLRSCYVKGRGWKDITEPKDEKFGEEGSMFNQMGHCPGDLANWYLLSGNENALRLSGELVRFLTKHKFWGVPEEFTGVQEQDSVPGRTMTLPRIDYDGVAGKEESSRLWYGVYRSRLKEYPGVAGKEHGHWHGHFHGHINTLRSILEYAIAANDALLKTFVRDGYEWARQQWLSRIGFCAVADGQGCGCGRLIGLAVKLTYAGVGDYWDDVDGYIRNHGTEMQFTKDDIDYLLKCSEEGPSLPDAWKPPKINTERVTEKIIGGFATSPEKRLSAHCCSSHGNMGLFYAWDGIVRVSDGTARVNLLLNRVSPWVDIDSYLPYEGKVVLKNKTAKEVFVRIPLWADKKEVTCTVNEKQMPNQWFGNYVRFKGLKSSDIITIKFPVVETTENYTITVPIQDVSPFIEKDSVHTLKFKGNTLIEISPSFPSLPPRRPITHLYKNRGHYRATKAPMKKVSRYVPDKVLQW